MPRTSWRKNLTVDRQVIQLLSNSTYEDFPSALREMVSNAYDADATEVRIEINIKGDFIRVTDNGNGMTPDDFDFFLRIAGQRRERKFSPEYRRQRIGQFGIGFLAVFPFGNRIKISSTARRSDIKFEATVPASEFFRQETKVIDIESIPIPGIQDQSPDQYEEHGTEITITGLTDMVRRYFQKREYKTASKKKSIAGLNPLERLKWSLQDDLPIDYEESTVHADAFQDLGPSGLKVWLNSEELFRNSVGEDVLENDTWKHKGIECRYIITTDWRAISPYEARQLKQRVRNVGVGKRTAFGLGTEGRAFSRLHWISGEIRIIKGFDELLTIDRNKFKESPETDEFSEFFKARLRHYANYIETVAEAGRDIQRQVNNSRVAEVGSRQQVVSKNLDILKSKGFKVVEKPVASLGGKSEPVSVDAKNKVVEVLESHPKLIDTATVNGKQIPARYTTWKLTASHPAIRRAKDGTLEINTDYPLFKSRRYGEVIKRLMILIFLASEDSRDPAKMASEIMKNAVREFEDLT